MAIQVVPDGLLQLVVRRALLEALAEKVPQVLVQLSSYRKRVKQTEHINHRPQELSLGL